MTLARFCNIRPAFHTEDVESAVRYKCHQLRYLIISVNDSTSINFYLVLTAAFDEGGI